jgi:hypothetical protein
MSIVYEALKKVEQQKGQPPSVIQIKRKLLNWQQVVSIVVMLIVVFSVYFWKKTPVLPANQEKQAVVTGDKSKPVIQQKKSYPRSAYTLEGIIYESDVPLAVVNGKLLKERDIIGEWKVTKINPASVSLVNVNDNTTLILNF